jgi:hypothetical protein
VRFSVSMTTTTRLPPPHGSRAKGRNRRTRVGQCRRQFMTLHRARLAYVDSDTGRRKSKVTSRCAKATGLRSP